MNEPLTDPMIRRVRESVHALREEMVAALAELVRVPTVNPPGADYRPCAELLAGWYRQLGYEVTLVEATDRAEHSSDFPRVNVLARRGAGGRTLHFNGHFDVVPSGAGWTVPPFGGLIRDGRLYGRGSADQKSGLIASLFAIEALRRCGVEPGGTIEQSATVDEESGGFAGVAHLCQQGLVGAGRTDYVIITEPLGHDRICLGHRGVYWFELIAHGRIAHGSMPALGVNAADLLSATIDRINRELKPRLAERSTDMPVEPPPARHPTLNLNGISGGQLTDALQTPCVPDVARAVYDRRFIAEEPFDSVRAEIAEVVSGAHAGQGGRLELRDLMVVEPVQTAASAAVVSALGDAIRAVVGRPPALIASPGTYDQKHVTGIGRVRECVAYGPGILELAHQPDEYVEIDHLVASSTVMALATLALLGH